MWPYCSVGMMPDGCFVRSMSSSTGAGGATGSGVMAAVGGGGGLSAEAVGRTDAPVVRGCAI